MILSKDEKICSRCGVGTEYYNSHPTLERDNPFMIVCSHCCMEFVDVITRHDGDMTYKLIDFVNDAKNQTKT